MDRKTDGARALRRWRLDQDITQAAACRLLRFSEARYSRIERGSSLPTLAQAVAIEREAGIGTGLWYQGEIGGVS